MCASRVLVKRGLNRFDATTVIRFIFFVNMVSKFFLHAAIRPELARFNRALVEAAPSISYEQRSGGVRLDIVDSA